MNARDRIISTLDEHPHLLEVAEPLVKKLFEAIRDGRRHAIAAALARAHGRVDEMANARRPDVTLDPARNGEGHQ